jgi:hypothetical protein
MAGINVNQITSMLAKLQPDSALQQYAQMHKNDPYIMALASSESNRRKELRAAAQAAAAGQPQPKVVDAAVAQMASQQLPEQMGIGQLPAPNMQFGAEGGIMGYDEGYDEGGMTYGQEPVMMMAGGGVARFKDEGLVSADVIYDPATGLPIADPAAYGGIDDRTIMERLGIFNPENRRALERAEQKRLAPKIATPSPTDPNFRRLEDPRMKPEIAATAQPLITSAPTKRRDAAPRPGAGPAASAAAAVSKEDPFSMEFLKKAQQEAGSDYSGAELRNRAVEMRSKLEQQGEDRLAARRKEIESEGDIYKGREDRLAKRETDIGKQKGENEGLALLNAGLAIMSTPGKLAEAIGKGAQVGTAQYASGLKDLRVAQQKLEDARDNIEELRLNRSDMNKRDIRALEKERDANVNEGNKIVFGVAQNLYGLDREDTRSLVKSFTDGQQTKARINSAEKIAALDRAAANARAKMPAADIQRVERIMADKKITFTEALEMDAKLRRPGVDSQSLSRFQKDNEREISELTALSRSKKPETIQDVANRKAALRAAAIAAGIDPSSIALLGGQSGASSSGLDLSQWGDVKKN